MMRLAEYLMRWTGDVRFADYYERNLWNGILAQQNPGDGRISYFLGTQAGARRIGARPQRPSGVATAPSCRRTCGIASR